MHKEYLARDKKTGARLIKMVAARLCPLKYLTIKSTRHFSPFRLTILVFIIPHRR